MYPTIKLSGLALALALSLGCASSWAQSDSKLTSEFSGWAGSTQNAQALVNGLRNDSSITLTSKPTPGTGDTTGTTSSFTPNTNKLGNGEVRIALSLAKAELAQMGITQPTPAQISAALNGGMISSPTGTVSTQGVLGMRASGMGWGEVAKSLGVKVGGLMRSDKADKAQDGKSKTSDKGDHMTGHDNKGDHGSSGSQGGGSSGSHGGGGGGGGHGGGK